MTIKEMWDCATETLLYFIQIMPDVPFTEDDIIIEFVPQKDIVERYKELRDKYCPERIVNDSQFQDLAVNAKGNAIIGREKSAVIVCIDRKQDTDNLRRIMFHEYMHIYCAKTEIDGEHFIDIYGTGTTPERGGDFDIYDGQLASGYDIWEEFIAHYYSFKYTEKRKYAFSTLELEYIFDLLSDIVADNMYAKGSLSYVCAILLTCTDADKILENLKTPNFIYSDDNPNGKIARVAFSNCLSHLYSQMQKEKPWKINEPFISEIGGKYTWFAAINSIYLGMVKRHKNL